MDNVFRLLNNFGLKRKHFVKFSIYKYDGIHTCKGTILIRLVWLTGFFMREQWQIIVSIHIRLKRSIPLLLQSPKNFFWCTNMAARSMYCTPIWPPVSSFAKRSLGSTVKRNCKFNCLFNFAGNASQEVHILCLRKWSIFLQSYFRPLLSVIRTKRPDLKQLSLLW